MFECASLAYFDHISRRNNAKKNERLSNKLKMRNNNVGQ